MAPLPRPLLDEPELAPELFPFEPEFEFVDALPRPADSLLPGAVASGVAAAAIPGDVAAAFDEPFGLPESLLLPCDAADEVLPSRDAQMVESRDATARPEDGAVVPRARPLVTLLMFSRTSPIGAAMRILPAGRAGTAEGVAAGLAAIAVRAAVTGAAGLDAVARVAAAAGAIWPTVRTCVPAAALRGAVKPFFGTINRSTDGGRGVPCSIGPNTPDPASVRPILPCANEVADWPGITWAI